MKKTLAGLITSITIIWAVAIFSLDVALMLFALAFAFVVLSLDPNKRRGSNQHRSKYRLTK